MSAREYEFNRRVATWQRGLLSALLARNKTAGVFDAEYYVPGDDAAMGDNSIEILDAGHLLYLESEGAPVGILVNLSELNISRPSTLVFGPILVVPDIARERMQLVGICTPYQKPEDLAALRNNVQGSRLVRGRQACEQLGVEMKLRRTRRGETSLSVELDLSAEDLQYFVDLSAGVGWDRPLEQVENFGKTLVQVSNALQGTDSSRPNGNCYVATAVYGSYDAPEVLVLRRFRDVTLRRSASGRAFIRAYYAVSPPLAKRLGRAKVANHMVRALLDMAVARLDRTPARR